MPATSSRTPEKAARPARSSQTRAGSSRTLSRAQARRIALAAQGFAGRDDTGNGGQRPDRVPTTRDIQSVINRLAQFQIDTINIVARAHYLPLFSRLGPYNTDLLDRAFGRAPRRMFEYWGHAASLIDVELQPSLRFRMQFWADHEAATTPQTEHAYPGLEASVLAQIGRRPRGAREIDHIDPDAPERRREHWGWNWSDVKTTCERLFRTGAITSARRNGQFERQYAVPEQVLPRRILEAPTPSPQEAMRTLVRRAAGALGVASEYDLRDYFRTSQAATRPAIGDLVDAGELIPVSVEGWDKPTYLWHQAKIPRRIEARALVSPFDSVMFERDRLEALFDFFYRIEIYVPAQKRIHGYYVYPFLLGDRFVARVDLKADRTAGTLRVKSAWAEADAERGDVAPALASELALMAEWLGLSDIEVADRGDLAADLQRSVSSIVSSGASAHR